MKSQTPQQGEKQAYTLNALLWMMEEWEVAYDVLRCCKNWTHSFKEISSTRNFKTTIFHVVNLSKN